MPIKYTESMAFEMAIITHPKAFMPSLLSTEAQKPKRDKPNRVGKRPIARLNNVRSMLFLLLIHSDGAALAAGVLGLCLTYRFELEAATDFTRSAHLSSYARMRYASIVSRTVLFIALALHPAQRLLSHFTLLTAARFVENRTSVRWLLRLFLNTSQYDILDLHICYHLPSK
jgi:hypothetical protein